MFPFKREFIAEIKRHPILFKDAKNPTTDIETTCNLLWDQLAKQFNIVNGFSAREFWNSLVRKYTRFLAGNEYFENPEDMYFMQEHILRRKSTSENLPNSVYDELEDALNSLEKETNVQVTLGSNPGQGLKRKEETSSMENIHSMENKNPDDQFDHVFKKPRMMNFSLIKTPVSGRNIKQNKNIVYNSSLPPSARINYEDALSSKTYAGINNGNLLNRVWEHNRHIGNGNNTIITLPIQHNPPIEMIKAPTSAFGNLTKISSLYRLEGVQQIKSAVNTFRDNFLRTIRNTQYASEMNDSLEDFCDEAVKIISRPMPIQQIIEATKSTNTTVNQFSPTELIFLGYAKALMQMPLPAQLKIKRQLAEIMDETETELYENAQEESI